MVVHHDPTWLRQQYIDNGTTAAAMAAEAHVSESTVRHWLHHHGITKPKKTAAPGGHFDIAALEVKANDLVNSGQMAPSTADATERNNALFEEWRQNYGLAGVPVTESQVLVYVTDMAESGLAANTIRHRVNCIRRYHTHHGQPLFETGQLRAALKGVDREHGRPPEKANAISREQLVEMLSALELPPEDLHTLRARVVFLMSAVHRHPLAAAAGATVSQNANGTLELHVPGTSVPLPVTQSTDGEKDPALDLGRAVTRLLDLTGSTLPTTVAGAGRSSIPKSFVKSLKARLTRAGYPPPERSDEPLPPMSPKTMAGISRRLSPHWTLPVRDAAMLGLMWVFALRPNGLAAVRRGDVSWRPGAMELTVPRDKTDQSGEGFTRRLNLPETPEIDLAGLLHAWCQVRDSSVGGDPEGALFCRIDQAPASLPGPLTRESVALKIRKAADAAGTGVWFSGHSPRRGFATWAAQAGVPMAVIAAWLGHASVESTIGYVDVGNHDLGSVLGLS